MVTEAHETSARGAKTGPQGAVLERIGLLHPPPNRSLVRVAVASRLMASHWKKTGENLRGSSVIGCGRWRAYGADSTIAEIQVDHRGPRLLGHFACRSVWSCDHCAKARVAQTRSWLRSALMPALEARGLSGSLVTLTLAHPMPTIGRRWLRSSMRPSRSLISACQSTTRRRGQLANSKPLKLLSGAMAFTLICTFC